MSRNFCTSLPLANKRTLITKTTVEDFMVHLQATQVGPILDMSGYNGLDSPKSGELKFSQVIKEDQRRQTALPNPFLLARSLNYLGAFQTFQSHNT